jgi:hypothetical protein
MSFPTTTGIETMGPIWITSCHCGQGHVILAMAIDSRENSLEDAPRILEAEVKRRIAERSLEPACGICSNAGKHYKTRPSELINLAEGRLEAARLEARQMEAISLAREFRAKQGASNKPLMPIDDRL